MTIKGPRFMEAPQNPNFSFKIFKPTKGFTFTIRRFQGFSSFRNEKSSLKIVVISSLTPIISDNEVVNVNVGECYITNRQEVVSTLVGSCIAVIIHESKLKIGGLAHILLPQHKPKLSNQACKYAATAIPHLISEVEKRGGRKSNMVSAIIGGSQLLNLGANGFSVGKRNVEVALSVLSSMGIPVVAQDVGGVYGRSVMYDASQGTIYVKYTSSTNIIKKP